MARKILKLGNGQYLGKVWRLLCRHLPSEFHSANLKEVFIARGIPPMVNSPDAVYEALVVKVEEPNKVYYAKYSQDVRNILGFLEGNNVVIPNSGNMTVSNWQQLDLQFGLHSRARVPSDHRLRHVGKLSYGLIDSIHRTQHFDTNPIYAVLHEPIYCQGRRHKAGWSAQRVIQKNDRFVWEKVRLMSDDVPIYFTGQMIFPDTFEDYHYLRPLQGVVELLAYDEDWPMRQRGFEKEPSKSKRCNVAFVIGNLSPIRVSMTVYASTRKAF
ncbi:uncharacterized protein EDB93DRAFT_340883 [Suillus bovinus]|uniref:uncharacterized protein n=1 Tax=Suillus bovinus TaxID=48563 RepID=UPI001B8741A1|nr:uncharacterized protein EDB93DRAFT_340883 [Suillus bovinus]KAG2150246.1 hypothetical protein EDB93DRAFT_340883 [Suillus bovinus]